MLNEGIWNQEQAFKFWQVAITNIQPLYTPETNEICLRTLPLLVSVLAQFLHQGRGTNDLIIDSLPVLFRDDVQDWLGKTLGFPCLLSILSWICDEDMEDGSI